MKMRALLRWRMLLGVGVLAALAAPLTATGGGSAKVSTSDARRKGWPTCTQIDQIEVTCHRATSTHNLEPDDVVVGSRCRLQHRPADADRQGADQALVRDGEQGVHAEPPLGVGHPDLQEPRDGERRQGDALFRVPLHRSRRPGRWWPSPASTTTLQKINGTWLIVDSAGATCDVARIDAGRPMAQSQALDAPRASRRWAALGGAGQPARPLRCGRAGQRCARSCWLRSWRSRRCSSSSSVLGLQVLGRANARVECARHAAAPVRHVSGARGIRDRPAPDCSACAPRGTPAVTPYTGGKISAGRTSSGGSPTFRSPTCSPRSSSAPNEALFGFVPPPADERVLRRIRLDYRTIVRALERIETLDRSGVRPGTRRSPYLARRASPPTTTSTRARPNLAESTATETKALIAGQPKRVHVVAESLHRSRRGERRSRTRTRRDPLVVADRPRSSGPRHGWRRSRRATSRVAWTCRIAMSSERSQQT